MTQSSESEARVDEDLHFCWMGTGGTRIGTPPKGSSLHENISCAPSLAGMTHVRWTLLEFLARATPWT